MKTCYIPSVAENYARVNWKSLGEVRFKRPSSWSWNAPRKRGKVKFIPNPATTEKLVRVKIGRGKAKLFRAPKAKVVKVAQRAVGKLDYDDRNACTVNALATVAGIPFFMAQKAMERAGRKRNDGFLVDDAIKAKKIPGFKFASILRKKMSLSEFLAKHPVGKFYVTTTSHAFAVIHGKVYDWMPKVGANRRIVSAYTVKTDGRE